MVRHYYIVGGMPKVVSAYAENKDMREVRRIQRTILADCRRDFAKHAPKGEDSQVEVDFIFQQGSVASALFVVHLVHLTEESTSATMSQNSSKKPRG